MNKLFIFVVIIIFGSTLNISAKAYISENIIYYDSFFDSREFLSEAKVLNVSKYSFTTIEVNESQKFLKKTSIHLVGNGIIKYDLAKFSASREVYPSDNFMIAWKDFGELNQSTYIGILLRFSSQSGENKTIYLGKYTDGTYANTTSSLLKFSSPEIKLGDNWEYWGFEMEPIFKFFGADTLTLNTFMYISAASISYHGDRDVYFSIPYFVNKLPVGEGIFDKPFLGLQNNSNNVFINDNERVSEEEEITLTLVVPSLMIYGSLALIILIRRKVYSK